MPLSHLSGLTELESPRERWANPEGMDAKAYINSVPQANTKPLTPAHTKLSSALELHHQQAQQVTRQETKQVCGELTELNQWR